jgi:hypothetical protein
MTVAESPKNVQMAGRVLRKDGDYFSYEPIKILELNNDPKLLDKLVKGEVK